MGFFINNTGYTHKSTPTLPMGNKKKYNNVNILMYVCFFLISIRIMAGNGCVPCVYNNIYQLRSNP